MSEIVKMSRRLDKMPIYFKKFILHHSLWPQLGNKSDLVKEFSVRMIEQDIRGNTIKQWQRIVNHELRQHSARLEYIRATGKQHLIFSDSNSQLLFVMRWS